MKNATKPTRSAATHRVSQCWMTASRSLQGQHCTGGIAGGDSMDSIGRPWRSAQVGPTDPLAYPSRCNYQIEHFSRLLVEKDVPKIIRKISAEFQQIFQNLKFLRIILSYYGHLGINVIKICNSWYLQNVSFPAVKFGVSLNFANNRAEVFENDKFWD